jgi:toxin FitB
LSFLLDTNVVSELRRHDRCRPAVRAWFDGTAPDELHLSILTLAELFRGAERLSRRDPDAGRVIADWVSAVEAQFSDRILGITPTIARTWARISVPDPLPIVDGFLAATAIVHGLTLVTRNVADVARTGVALLNPFEP